MKISFGKKIAKLREEEGLGITAFAKAIGIARRRIYEFEHQEVKNPTLDTLHKIVKAFPEYASYFLEIDIKKLPKQKSIK